MEVKASLKHLRMSPQKVRLVVDLVRKLTVEDALNQLRFVNKLAAGPLSKLIKSGIANAENTYNLKRDNLYIKEIRSDAGVTLKRWMPRAHGRATTIRKRACHISLILAEIKESGAKKKEAVKIAEPVKLEKLAKESDKTSPKTISKKVIKNQDKKAVGQKDKIFRRKAG